MERSRDSGRRSSRDEAPSRRGREEETPSRRGGRGEDSDANPRGRSSGRSFEYQERSSGDAKKRATSGPNEYDKILIDSVKSWKVNDGDNRIRILPATWPGAKHYGLDIYVHYGVGADRGTYLCPHKMQEKECPICEEREEAKRDDDEKYAKELEPKRRVLVYLIDRDHPKDGIQAWAMPWTVDRDIVKVSIDKSTGEVLPIDHPDEGFDIEFEKKGAKDRTEYLGVAVARRSTPLDNDAALDAAMDSPLPEIINYFDYDHIGKAFGGATAHKGGDRPSRDKEDEDRPSGRRSEPERGSSRSKDEPTWDSIHDMTSEELDDFIEQEDLDIDPKEAKDDEDLADWICEELKLKKPEPKASRRSTTEDEDDSASRLRKMREGRR